MNINNIIIGRPEICATVYVPWDCGCNCKFCTTKKEYLLPKYQYSENNIRNIMESLKKISKSHQILSVVFTGGEPFINPKDLIRLFKVIPRSFDIYVNSNMHMLKFIKDINILRSLNKYITGISVSIHPNEYYSNNEWEILRYIKDNTDFKMRCNSVISDSIDFDIIKFLSKIKNSNLFYELNFRKDFNKTNQSNLHSYKDKFLQKLITNLELDYRGQSGCLVCSVDKFIYDNFKINYHRGTPNSSVLIDNTLIINDFIIKQDGELRYDWCKGTKLTNELLEALNIK